MRRLVYLIMFGIVATGSIMMLMFKCSLGFPIFLNFITLISFADPIPVLLVYQLPFFGAQEILVIVLKFTLLALVFHRLYRIFTERRFNAPDSFNDLLFIFGAVSVGALFLALPLIGIYLGLVSALGFMVAKICLPFVFFITELLSVKEYFRRKQSLHSSQ